MNSKAMDSQQLDLFLGGNNLLKLERGQLVKQSAEEASTVFDLSHETSEQDEKANACSGDACKNCKVCFFDKTAQ